MVTLLYNFNVVAGICPLSTSRRPRRNFVVSWHRGYSPKKNIEMQLAVIEQGVHMMVSIVDSLAIWINVHCWRCSPQVPEKLWMNNMGTKKIPRFVWLMWVWHTNYFIMFYSKRVSWKNMWDYVAQRIALNSWKYPRIFQNRKKTCFSKFLPGRDCEQPESYLPGTRNNQFLMDVWWNNHFPSKDLESSNWNNHLINGCFRFQVVVNPPK